MLKHNLVLNASCNFSQNVKVKHGSLSKIMDTRFPYWLTSLSTYNLSNLSNGNVCLMGIKCAIW